MRWLWFLLRGCGTEQGIGTTGSGKRWAVEALDIDKLGNNLVPFVAGRLVFLVGPYVVNLITIAHEDLEKFLPSHLLKERVMRVSQFPSLQTQRTRRWRA